MNPAYPSQAYQPGRPTAPPPAYGTPSNHAPPQHIGFNPSLYQQQPQAYPSTTLYASVAPPTAQYRYSPIYSSAPAYMSQAPGVSAMAYNQAGAYNPGQPTYIHQQAVQPSPVSNLTVVQPTRTMYMPNGTPSSSMDVAALAGLGFVAGAALGGGHHHHHGYGYGYGNHPGGHHGFGHGFGHHGHHC